MDVGGLETLDVVENIPTGSLDRPVEKLEILRVEVFVNPFREYEDIQSGKLVKEESKPTINGTVMKVGDQWIACDEILTVSKPKVPKATGVGVGKYLQLGKRSSDSTNTRSIPQKKKVHKTEFKDFSSW